MVSALKYRSVSKKFSALRCVGTTVFLGAMTLLSACSTMNSSPPVVGSSPIPDVARVTATVTTPKVAKHFSMTGRISVRVDDRLDSAKIVWERTQDGERLKFFTPFGSQLAEVASDKDGATTMTQGNVTVAADSISELTKSLLGVSLVTDEIARWVQGDGLTENKSFDFASADGTVWSVTAEKFELASSASRHRFVSRLSATKGGTRVRLVVDEWKAL